MQDKKYNLASAVRFCFAYAPGASFVKLLIEIVGGALTPLMVLVVASFIDNVSSFVSGEGKIIPVIAAILLMASCYAWSQVSQIIARIADKTLDNALCENLRPQLVQKHSRISFALLENPETLDLAARVCGNAEGRIAAILKSGISIIRFGIQIFGTLSLLALHVWWMLPLFVVGSMPIILIARRGGRAVYLKDAAITNLTRQFYYLSDILSGRETAAERALFGYTDSVNKKFSAVHLERSNMNTKNIAVEHITIHSCGLIVNALVMVAVVALLRPAGDTMTHGLYVSLVGAMIGFSRIITGAVSDLMWEIAEYIEYMREYAKYFALPETDAKSGAERKVGSVVTFDSLEIRNLKFRYTPGGPYVLDGVSLKIEKGKSYSLIGPNGAGKSTLTKILLGLYRDFEGEIKINGADIASYSANELRCLFSIVYQDFAKYYIPFGDNVTLGDENKDFASALRLAELEDVEAGLPEGKNTPLGKIYENGTDISGGEWQRVTIARALYANAPFMILDEPTASLDPMAESKLYKRFAEITKEKTSLLISHRLGSTKLSDVLFVLNDGIIAETGTHDELIDANGIYAEMFDKQRSWYDL
jgi:ATP-binding cassette subfamily B protein